MLKHNLVPIMRFFFLLLLYNSAIAAAASMKDDLGLPRGLVHRTEADICAWRISKGACAPLSCDSGRTTAATCLDHSLDCQNRIPKEARCW